MEWLGDPQWVKQVSPRKLEACSSSTICPLVKILEQGGLGIGTRNGRRKGRSRHPSQSWCAPRPLPSGYLGGDARARLAQTGEMAPLARRLFWGRLGSCPATPGWGTVVFVWLFLSTLCTGTESGVPGAAERREGTVEGRWMEFSTAQEAGELGEGERRD